MTILALAAVSIAAFWVALTLDPLRRFPRDRFLRQVEPPAAGPPVAVLVPARDEASVLPLTLPALLAQRYPGFEVVLVDDASTDGTAEAAARIAVQSACNTVHAVQGSGSLRIVAAGDKPPGWVGKMHALQRGFEALSATDAASPPPTWILLTDADIRHPPTSIASLVAKAQRTGDDLVSVMARLSTAGVWERLLIPPFVYFFHLLYPFRAVAQRSSEVAAAAGGCVLVRASALLDAGGFTSLRDALIDDVALARLLKGRRRRLWLGLDPAIESVRRYGFRDLWRMVARSAFVELGYRYSLVPLVAVGLAFFFAGPPAIVLTSVAALALGIGGPAVWIAFALGALARFLETWVLLPWVRHHGITGWRAVFWSLTFPQAALVYGAMTVGSAWDHLRGRGSSWKGRGYDAPEGADTFTTPR